MKTKLMLILLTLLLALALVLACGSSDDDDDDNDDESDDDDAGSGDEIGDLAQFFSFGGADPASDFVPDWSEENCPAYECTGNSPTVLDQALFMINGVQVADLSSVSVGDEVRVVIGYADDDCNLACGSYAASDMRPDTGDNSMASLPSNLPCSTADSNLYFGFYYDSVIAGNYSYMLRVNDFCAAESNRIEGGFAVQ